MEGMEMVGMGEIEGIGESRSNGMEGKERNGRNGETRRNGMERREWKEGGN
jgi:hypothetical protein